MSSLLHRMRIRNDRSSSSFGSESAAKCGKKRDTVSLLDDSFSHPASKIVEETTSKASTTKDDEFLKPLKRGFLNESAAKRKDIPFIKSKANPKGSKTIPEFMQVSSPLDKYREELQGMLKPTQEIVKEVLDNDSIKNGLEDPEVMAAVQAIASDYSAIAKYRNNPKVTKFYSQLGMVMGNKLEKQGKPEKPQ